MICKNCGEQEKFGVRQCKNGRVLVFCKRCGRINCYVGTKKREKRHKSISLNNVKL